MKNCKVLPNDQWRRLLDEVDSRTRIDENAKATTSVPPGDGGQKVAAASSSTGITCTTNSLTEFLDDEVGNTHNENIIRTDLPSNSVQQEDSKQVAVTTASEQQSSAVADALLDKVEQQVQFALQLDLEWRPCLSPSGENKIEIHAQMKASP
jgi:hypothetical protein